jgi:hypothetical protein
MYGPQSAGGAALELRTAADPQAILPAIREVVAQVNTNLPLFDVKTESEQIDRLLVQERLACVGLYGLPAYGPENGSVTALNRDLGPSRHVQIMVRLAFGETGKAADHSY